MDSPEQYNLLQNLASPLAAVTTVSGSRRNGMITNSASRASIVPETPRVSFYCFKRHYSHELLEENGWFCLHLLHRGQFKTVRALGFETGRHRDKLDGLPWRRSKRGLPVLECHYAWFECRIVNAMDAGPSTVYLGEVKQAGENPDREHLRVMTSEFFRSNMPGEWKQLYEENKQVVQTWGRMHGEINRSYEWTMPGSR